MSQRLTNAPDKPGVSNGSINILDQKAEDELLVDYEDTLSQGRRRLLRIFLI
ncbi:hypothetical protein OS493_001318, partial [Desmophyllum pertusum]